MTVVLLSDYAKDNERKSPGCITFFASRFSNQHGTDFNLSVTVRVEDGDVFGILDVVKEEGGVGQMHGDQYIYIPWPCACVAIHAPDEQPLGTLGRSDNG